MKEFDSSVGTELPIVNAAVEQMKVILERNEEISGASFWWQKRGDAVTFPIMQGKQFYQLHWIFADF